MVQRKPNILITGTPGVGKSTLCKEIIKNYDLRYLEVSSIAKKANCYSGYDDKLETMIIDEDKLLDEMEPLMADGGNLVEYHSSELFPERWFDLVFVLCTDNTILYDRLKERGYNDLKITKNVECEIFQFSYEEAFNAYNPNIVHKLSSDTDVDVERNIKTVIDHIKLWASGDDNK